MIAVQMGVKDKCSGRATVAQRLQQLMNQECLAGSNLAGEKQKCILALEGRGNVRENLLKSRGDEEIFGIEAAIERVLAQFEEREKVLVHCARWRSFQLSVAANPCSTALISAVEV